MKLASSPSLSLPITPSPHLILVCLLSLSLVSPNVEAQDRPRSKQPPLALTHVTVIDATGAPAKPDMTVIIDAGRIYAIGKSSRLRVPRHAEVINARGKFLIPGLWDMHVHIGDDPLDRNSNLSLFVANGVTGIRIMEGAPKHHLWRKEVEEGKLLGPRMIIASAIIDGPKSDLSDAVKVGTQAEARQAVRNAKQGDADFVKIHDTVPREAYFALLAEARLLGLPVSGHVPQSVTPVEVAEEGQRSVEHFSGLGEAETDASRADSVVAAFKKNGTLHCPTLIMRNNYASLDDAGLANDPRLRYVKPSWRKSWLRMTNDARSVSASDWAKRKETVRREKALVGRMQRGGVGILAGTDDANPYVIPGFSLHDELVLLVESGLTPMQALQAATLRPAKFLYRLDSLGTVAVGKLADLVLLDANPLADIHNTTRINSVVVNGQLLRRESLNEILGQVEAAMKE